MKLFSLSRTLLLCTIFMLTWQFNNAQFLSGAICRGVTTILPVKKGCGCSLRWRFLGYFFNVKLSNCELNASFCLDGKKPGDSKSLCGSPVISTDLYGRFRPSTIALGLNNITGWEKLIPFPVNSTVNVKPLITSLSVSLTLKTGININNIASSLSIVGCGITLGGQKCTQCVPCQGGTGINFTCSNVKILSVDVFNVSVANISLPLPPTCLAIPGIPQS